ncbi:MULTISPECIES: ATP-binding cassette domain-containing protein [unclassified Mucilaginibacter]|uniref:ABC transporter ATP-binding protein n=1 Tax=unclassified Mucilaginibacter TaxID=2617802 RepID=UPI002AC8F8E0|nr:MULTISPECIES: ATP-binding cassette domain-containing protein [unclassified Mucilaginibacter]MEB0263832.1 ATP-binding cassette domain-containing protein [Mucilaginibacter sp. 10I4]MEB0279770.1 ATP-binding cassette domain-containing protein [Mucilaginibacter sp. 10B2]MEB0301607.1 ATP-binding cassette domain-containing protein [Mucilaginibacter sp. 5C4]WPX25688.1 ATP-binding cassette domain-containing protein [Mucilaginibacter sp. 5C4]
MQVPAGSIYGFLGPNGAGKTTTIKMLLNLLQAGEGSIHIFEKELNSNRIEVLKQIGSLIEQPAIYHHLTGRENLLNRAMLLQVNEAKVDEMLKLVQLTNAADKKAGQYSLDMKQRLGIALALLADPKLLILDEPTNGLDPNGIIEIRELLMRLVATGKTVFISSHLLAEIEKMATHVGIINNGQLMFQGTIGDLQNISQPLINIETDNTVDAANLLKRHNFTVTDVDQNHLYVPFTSKEQIGEINTLLIQNGITVFGINKQRKDLERLFLDITTQSN